MAVTCQASLSMGFSRQEYWRGLSCSPPGALPGPGIESMPPALAGGFFITSVTWKALSSAYRGTNPIIRPAPPTMTSSEPSACKYAPSCPTVRNPRGCSPPGSSVHGISQARILEQVAVSFSRGSSPSRDGTYISRIAMQILYH